MGEYMGNSYNPQPTPDWQKPLTSFFVKDPNKPPPKIKDEDEAEKDVKEVKDKGKGKGKGKSSKKEEKLEEDEENLAPNKKTDASSLQKNGVVSDDDDE